MSKKTPEQTVEDALEQLINQTEDGNGVGVQELEDLSPEDYAKLEKEIKEQLGDTLSARGPMWIPESFKKSQPDMEFALPLYDPEKPFKFYQTLRLGWQYVLPSEMPGLQEMLDAESSRFSSDLNQDKIIAGRKGKTYHVLMKMPKRRFKIIQRLKHQMEQEKQGAKYEEALSPKVPGLKISFQ